ncbi:MAG: methyltransferase domain-containing protein [Nitrincola lacisaponensis]|uniref:methyltransferase domain-containing protein n=1 Tax=Nitrincola lacisaponensis TaxID=267850 RepID=UPI00391B1687
MNPFSDAKVIDSWSKNVSQWTSAVRLGQIETRQCVTNQAIVDAVLQQSPESVIDIGCGEGWLVRALSPHAVQLLGVDAVPSLVEQARALGGGDLPYCDGWRAGSWAGFDASFIDPAPWYFRTLKNWFALLSVNGLRVIDISEPLDPKTQQPASIIFSAVSAAGSEDAPS